MSIGKYSPTVSRWYDLDQNWFEKHSDDGSWVDRDGYDLYGYHDVTGRDRAGYKEIDYNDGKWVGFETGEEELIYTLYFEIYNSWADVPFPWKNMPSAN